MYALIHMPEGNWTPSMGEENLPHPTSENSELVLKGIPDEKTASTLGSLHYLTFGGLVFIVDQDQDRAVSVFSPRDEDETDIGEPAH